MSEPHPEELATDSTPRVPTPPVRRSRPTLALLMLAVVAAAVPLAVASTFLRESGSGAETLWWLGVWGLGILLVAVAIGAWWRHTAAQVLGQIILVTALYVALIAAAGFLPDRDLIPHCGIVLAFGATVTLPLVLRRRALERHPPGPARERLLALAAVGLAAGLNLAVQIAYMAAFALIFN